METQTTHWEANLYASDGHDYDVGFPERADRHSEWQAVRDGTTDRDSEWQAVRDGTTDRDSEWQAVRDGTTDRDSEWQAVRDGTTDRDSEWQAVRDGTAHSERQPMESSDRYRTEDRADCGTHRAANSKR